MGPQGCRISAASGEAAVGRFLVVHVLLYLDLALVVDLQEQLPVLEVRAEGVRRVHGSTQHLEPDPEDDYD